MTYREAVLQLADRARQALPESIARIDKAVTLVLHGHVEQVGDAYQVASQCDSKKVYTLTQGSCPCRDFVSGACPQGLCKHRLSANIHRKALEMIKAQEPVATLPEAPASANVRVTLGGREIQITLRDSDEKRLLVRLADVLAQFPQEAPGVVNHEDNLCPIHHVPMKQRNGKYGLFHSHKTQSGWCQGKQKYGS